MLPSMTRIAVLDTQDDEFLLAWDMLKAVIGESPAAERNHFRDKGWLLLGVYMRGDGSVMHHFVHDDRERKLPPLPGHVDASYGRVHVNLPVSDGYACSLQAAGLIEDPLATTLGE